MVLLRKPKTLRGGSFNLRYGRVPKRVVTEGANLFKRHDLDFLAVQEFSDYTEAFRRDPRFDVLPLDGSAESGIVVRAGLPVDRVSHDTYGNGWTTVRGGHYPPATHHEARLDGWLYVRSVHLPTPSSWTHGRPQAPADRLDDLVATVEGLSVFLKPRSLRNARVVIGDWNEPPETRGTYTPNWLAEQTGAKIACPDSRAGHGRIDYALYKGCEVTGTFKDAATVEFSDHEPVIFTITR